MESATQQNQGSLSSKEASHPAVMKKFSNKPLVKKNASLVIGSILVILAGVATGWFLSGRNVTGGGSGETGETSQGVEVSETEAGYSDESLFTEEQSPEGVLVEGGIEGEGTHHLDRGLGKDKYVYLTSTVIDLQSFVGKKVKIWGETLSGLHAGWLMDVGKIKEIE